MDIFFFFLHFDANLSFSSFFFLSFKQIAAASLFLSLSVIASLETNERPIDYESLWTKTIIFYTTYELKDLFHIVADLINYVKVAPTTKTNNVYNKYRNTKFNGVASIVLKSDASLNEILSFVS